MYDSAHRLAPWAVLLATAPSSAAAAAPGWDTGQATQGLILLAGFAVVVLVGLALLARFFGRFSARGRPRRR
jgi:hypothetical protein